MTVNDGGDPGRRPQPQLDEVLAAVNTRNQLLRRLAGSVDGLSRHVGQLRREIDDRPTRQQAEHRRRRTAAAMLLFGIVLVWGHDQHVEACSPGANSQAVLRDLASDPGPSVLSDRRMSRVIEDQQPTERCDVMMPVHAHDPDEVWPTRWNWVGFGLYLLVGGILWVWQRGPSRSPEPGRAGRGEE